jgi:pyruvate/2-oxoglutarate dehydrogenase complex dihydrolipoamide dehydrogenase (E3) component
MTLPSKRRFDVALLGCGAAAKNIGPVLARAGMSVVIVERRYIGGSCPNIACLPSKNLVYSARRIHEAASAANFGALTVTEPIDLSVVRRRISAMVERAVQTYSDRFRDSGVELLWGNGRLVGDRLIEIEDAGGVQLVEANYLVLNTGSRSTIPPIPGLADSSPLTHVELLQLHHLPRQLIVLGAGYVGLEFAQAMRRLGSQVTVIDRNAEILEHEDSDFTNTIMKTLEEEGVRFLLATQVERVEGTSGSDVMVRVRRANGILEHVAGTDILVALGRVPNTRGIGLEESGIHLRENGTIDVDESLQTSVPHVFAAGDCAGSPNFTHIAFDDFRIITAAILGRPLRSTADRQIPFCLYTDPEFCRVGLNEKSAREKRLSCRMLTLPVPSIGKSQTTGELVGKLRAFVDEEDRIVGFQALGSGVGELMAPIQLAMKMGIPYRQVGEMIFAHPTLSEGLMSLCLQEPKQLGNTG